MTQQSKAASAPVAQEVLQTKKQKLEVATSSLNTLDMKRITEIMDRCVYRCRVQVTCLARDAHSPAKYAKTYFTNRFISSSLFNIEPNQLSKGSILPAVLLKQDGTAIEVSFDTTPRLKEVNRIVGCDAQENITFAGQWEDVVDDGDSVLLILRSKAAELNLPINKKYNISVLSLHPFAP